MSFRIPCFTKTLLVTGCCLLVTASAFAQTPPTTLFQIDGNSASTPLNTCDYTGAGKNQLCDYWNLLNGDGTAGSGSAGSSTIRTFANGLASTDSFTGGSSKDPLPISGWAYSQTPTPNKDTLNAGYAAAYSAPITSDFMLMFGADRASPNGDANIGIWFFQQDVEPNGSGGFTGAHVDGDIFIISSFTGGGGTSTISVYAWASSCKSGVKNPSPGQCADSNLKLLASAAGSSVCGDALYCAITNSAAVTTTWEGSIASPLFFEGGINLTKALQGAGIFNLPCFSSFIEETRSSQSTSAVLKDFIAHKFPVCGLHITKACDNANNPPVVVNSGTAIKYTWAGTVQNTGIGTLSGVSVADALQEANNTTIPLTVTLSATTLNPKGQSGDTATYSVSYTSTALSETNQASASSTFGSTTINSDNSASATCSLSPSTALTVVKHCTAPGPGLSCSSSGCVVQVPFNAQVCNTGSVKVTGISLTDSPSATISNNGFALNPGQCTGGTGNPVNPSGTYQPTTSAGDGSTNGRYTFSDTISITSATPAITGALSTIPTGHACAGTYGCAPVSCPLCSSGDCSGALP
jgi:hypothetical protein